MIRVRRGAREQAAHTDDWLITYADMITLLLCFFVIFYVILSSRKNGPQEAPQAGFAAHVAELASPPTTQPSSTRVARHDLTSTSGTLGEFDLSKIIPAPVAIAAAPADAGAEAGASLSPAKADTADGVNGTQPLEQPDRAPKADRITAFELTAPAFFDSGSASLREDGKSFLRGVAAQLQSQQYDGYQIVVEGHTDDTPITTSQFSSNWELSTARAAAVVHFLIDQGIAPNKLRAAGYADTQPKLPNRDAEGNAIPGNQAQNRRVIIRLEKIEASR